VILRRWHGWATHATADAYESYLRTEVLPGIAQRVDGYRGAYVLRRDDGDEIEFATLTMFDSYDAVRAFAGDDYEHAVVPPHAQALLSRFDERSTHYEVVLEP
jgi:heme-degrading monooxygenase HmoA